MSDKPVRDAMDALRRIVQSLREGSRQAEKKVGVSAAQLFVLHRLHAGGARTINELAQETATHQSSVSVVVQRLVDRGLVRRGVADGDRRRREVELTAAGRRLVRRGPAVTAERLIAALSALPAVHVRQLAARLGALAAALGPGRTPPPMLFEDAPGRMGSHGSVRRRTVGSAHEARRGPPRRLSRPRPARRG